MTIDPWWGLVAYLVGAVVFAVLMGRSLRNK